jgi:hypothetical protein
MYQNSDQNESQVAEEICQIIADYQVGITPQRNSSDVINFVDNVNRICEWMGSAERLLFLQGLRSALTNSYWSATRIKMYMRPLLSMTGVNNGQDWVMLALQEDESSQLRLVRDVKVSDGLIISPRLLETHDSYIYVDDAAYTGRTLARYLDRIASEISDMSEKPRQLVIWHLVEYSNATMGRLGEPLAKLQNLNVAVTFQRVEDFNTEVSSDTKLGVLFPDRSCSESILVHKLFRANPFLAKARDNPRLWRDPNEKFQDGLFASSAERRTVELALLEVGCWLYIRTKSPKFRPLGYVGNFSDISFGFGSMFATCHNSANTTPIAMWWGDPTAHSSNPLSLWTPLLPRMAQ